jgi:hypothetical protein
VDEPAARLLFRVVSSVGADTLEAGPPPFAGALPGKGGGYAGVVSSLIGIVVV